MDTVAGIEILAKKLERLGGDLGTTLPVILRNAMRDRVESAAAMKCPVDTGTLRASIKTVIAKDSSDEVVITIGTNKAYAPHVEFGTGAHQKLAGHDEFVEAITRWASRHSVDELDDLIGHIQKHGTKPHPFLRPAWDEGKGKLLDDVKRDLSKEVRKLMQ